MIPKTVSQSTLTVSSIFDYSPDQLGDWLQTIGQPSYRKHQILQWIYKRGVETFEEMTDLSRSLRDKLQEAFSMELPSIIERREDKTDGTVKMLLQLSDGEGVETVQMPRYTGKIHIRPATGKVVGSSEARTHTLCLSTQAGCLFACRFCASGRLGWKRNLRSGEITAQVLSAIREGINVSHIVFMGMESR